MIEELREKIKAYYGAAMQIYPAAIEDFEKVDKMTDEEIIEEAKRLHLI